MPAGDRSCAATRTDGQPCRGTPLLDNEMCFWHSPEHAEEAKEARRLGGQRRRKERIVSAAYDFEGLSSAASIRRLVEVAVIDTLALENSIPRSRTLAYLAQSASRLMETSELEARIEELERTVAPRVRRMKRGKR